jgi:hypothetical protein
MVRLLLLEATEENRQKFMDKVRVFSDGCWTRPAWRDHIGTIDSHRAAWLLFRGPISASTNLKRTCNFAQCCNPDHLQRKDGKDGY